MPNPNSPEFAGFESQEAATASSEALASQAQEQVAAETNTRLGVQSADMYLENGDPIPLEHAGNNLNQAMESMSRRKNVAETVALKNSIVSAATVEQLPRLPGNLSVVRNAPTSVKVNEEFERSKGSNEHLKLQEIRRQLMATVAINEQSATINPKGSAPRAYFPMFDEEGLVSVKNFDWRNRLEEDLRWLSNDMRIGDNVPPERKKVFLAYRSLLADLTRLHPIKTELKYQEEANSVLAARTQLENACRDPRKVKQAAKFAVLLAAGALLTLFAVIDIRNKKISLKTLVMLGAVAYLMKGGNKFDFLSSKEFSRLSRENGLDGNATKKLQALALNKTSAYSHLTKTMEDLARHGQEITPKTIEELTNPTKKRSGREVPDPQKAVSPEIANLFLGAQPTDVLYVLQGIRKTARAQDRGLVHEFADFNNNSGTAQQDLADVQSLPPAEVPQSQ